MKIKDYRVVNILLPSYQGKKVILYLKKQRYNRKGNSIVNPIKHKTKYKISRCFN